ncbi:hypothetical protein [Dyadobacter chenhuakuii]|uniref:Uncharacterized protein n=1 Tax=Dyadobacter chenhuakuii TaxID=2909339 RepID=A0ABY4XRD3_9BACT|nr:hypothetical protein [Dyadobacter chenhuakuii]MCF2493027.1 hypothetical protein [Dyadobacter chenhuakuii]USJ32685.1 hypothetical protein NFI80_08040 [Dyadobacter chenhuakuii]
MKKYLVAMLFSLVAVYGQAQQDMSKSIAKKALFKMAGGKHLKTFERTFIYDLPGEVPQELRKASDMDKLMESIMAGLSESDRKLMSARIDSLKKKSFADMGNMYAGWQETVVSDLVAKKVVRVRTSPNHLTGVQDTSRSVHEASLNPIFDLLYQEVPVALLQYMVSDSAELHYTGMSNSGADENHMLQVRVGQKWIDVYIGKSSLLVNRVLEQQVDTDPLIGRGPEHFQQITIFSDYQKVEGFILPGKLEEVSSRGQFTTRKRIQWSNINKPIPSSTFRAEPTFEERMHFDTVKLQDSLFVMLRSGNGVESRSLIRLTSDNRIDCIMEPINHDNVVNRMASALQKDFPGKLIRNIYLIGSAPFDKDFQKNGVHAFVLNPEKSQEGEQLNVCYYLPKNKLMFSNGNPYTAYRNNSNGTIHEKWLYDFIKARNLNVEKILLAEAYVSGSPLEMSFRELETRVKNTDYSEYHKHK